MKKFHLVLGAVAASIATLVVVITVADPTAAPSDPFNGLHLSADDELLDDEILNAPFVSYESETFKYTVRYPGTWTLDDSRADFGGDILSDPSQRVVITFTETNDPDIVSMEGMKNISDSIKQSLAVDPSFDLEETQNLYWKSRPAIFTSGVRLIGGKRYQTREYNILRNDHGGILNISITTQLNSETLYEQPIRDILKSLEVCPK